MNIAKKLSNFLSIYKTSIFFLYTTLFMKNVFEWFFHYLWKIILLDSVRIIRHWWPLHLLKISRNNVRVLLEIFSCLESGHAWASTTKNRFFIIFVATQNDSAFKIWKSCEILTTTKFSQPSQKIFLKTSRIVLDQTWFFSGIIKRFSYIFVSVRNYVLEATDDAATLICLIKWIYADNWVIFLKLLLSIVH